MKKSLYSVIFLMLLASAGALRAQIQMTFSVVQPTCHGFTNGSATVSALGGSGVYTYAWSTLQTTQTTFGIGSGTFTVTVTDDAQNTASGSIFVAEPSAVTAAITASNVGCDGASGTLTASGFGGSGPYTYAWDGAGGISASATISVSAPGNYFVTVTDANNCSGVNSFTIATPLSLTVNATDIPCAIYPQGGAVEAVVTGSITPYIYSWSNGVSTQMQSGIGAGQYAVTVTAPNGCTITGQNTVDIPPALVVDITWLSPACGGNNNGAATVQASGGTPPYTYSWITPNQQDTLSGATQTGLAPGQYYVCTFDSNRCQKDLWVIIPATNGLDVQLSVTSATCVGIDNATATAIVNPPGSNLVYQWNILPADSSVAQLTGLAAGTVVTVVVTDTVSGCTGTATGTVGAHANLDINITDVDILCAGGFGSATAVASNGTPQYTYTWFDGNHVQIGNPFTGDTSSIFNLGAGAYLVEVVDSLGCEGKAVADIGIQSAPEAIIDSVRVLVCGDSLSTVQFINASVDPYSVISTIVWIVTGPHLDTTINQQNQITFQIPVDDTITVQLIATSALGCADTATLVYNIPGYPDITLSLDSSTINCVNAPVEIDVIGGDSSYTFVWTPSVVLNPNPLHVLVSPGVSTTYILTTTDGNACTVADSITIAPFDSLFQLFVSDTLIQTCSDSVILSASTSIPATITWSQGTTILIGNPVKVPATPIATVYTVTAMTADSCILTENVTVKGDGMVLSIDTSLTYSICEGDTLPLAFNVTPPSDIYVFEWSVDLPGIIINPSSANPLFTGPAGTYLITVIVKNDFCADTLQIPVLIKPSFDLDAHISIDLCSGLNVQFTNDSGITGQWSFGDGDISSEMNPLHVYDSAGQYLVIFTAAQECTQPWDTLITVSADTLRAAIAHMYVDCALDADIQFNGSTNNPGIFEWDWTFSNGTPATDTIQNPLITYTEEGTYLATLVVTDINHCTATATDSVTIDIIDDVVLDSVRICPGDSLQLNPSGIDLNAAYVWTASPADPTLNPNLPNPVVVPLVPTNYSVSINKGLCSVNYTIKVSFKTGSDVELPADTIVCSNDSLLITAQSNGALGYEWSNSPNFTNIFAITQSVRILPNDTYYVRTTGAECSDVDSIKVVLAAPEIQAIPTDLDICQGEETALMISNLVPGQNLTYVWSPSLPAVANPIVSPSETTTYTVTVTNQFGCTTTLAFTVNVTTVAVTAEADPDTVTTASPVSTLTAITGGNGVVISYMWTPAATLNHPDQQETQATPTETTTYTVKVTTQDGCMAIDTVTVYRHENDCLPPFVFVPNAFSPNDDNLNDRFIVRADGMTALKFIIWNRWGEIVYETDDPNDLGWDGSFKGKEATSDSFAWYVWLVCGNGETYEDKGNVTLLK